MNKVKPYNDFETAIKAYKNCYYLHSDIKIRCSRNNIGKDERTLIDAAFLCKIIATFGRYMYDFTKKYNIVHIGHTWWEPTTWSLKYKPQLYTFEIHSTSYPKSTLDSEYFEDKKCSLRDLNKYVDSISIYIDKCLSEVWAYAPSDRYEWIKERVQTIFDAETY